MLHLARDNEMLKQLKRGPVHPLQVVQEQDERMLRTREHGEESLKDALKAFFWRSGAAVPERAAAFRGCTRVPGRERRLPCHWVRPPLADHFSTDRFPCRFRTGFGGEAPRRTARGWNRECRACID